MNDRIKSCNEIAGAAPYSDIVSDGGLDPRNHPASDCGLTVVGYADARDIKNQCHGTFSPYQWQQSNVQLVRKSDADARDAMRLEQVKGLVEALEQITRMTYDEWTNGAVASLIAGEALAIYSAQEGK